MRDYIRIKSMLTDSLWLITPAGLDVILAIAEERFNHGKRQLDSEFTSDNNQLGTAYINGTVGVVPLVGPIFGKANLLTQMSGATSLEQFSSDFGALVSNDNVKSIIIQADTPGGTSDLVEEVANQIYAAREVKPVYTLADTLLGSAGLYLGSQADAIYSTSSGSVGSIGVYTVHEDRSDADRQDGVKYTYVSAGKYKTEGNPHEPLTEEGKAYRQEVVDEIYGEFVDAVARGRGVEAQDVIDNFGGGRMFTAKKALDVGLIDGITTMSELSANCNSHASPVGVFIGGAVHQAVLGNDGVFHLTGYKLESKEYEHSEPGTGSPPAPVTENTGQDDIQVTNRWRWDPLPRDPNDPTAPKPNSKSYEGGKQMTEEQLGALYELFSVEDSTALCNAIQNDHMELNSLKNSRDKLAEHDRKFAQDYPAEYALLMEQLDESRVNKAHAFANSVAVIRTPQGDGLKDTKAQLSVQAMDVISAVHKRFAEGVGTIGDFETAVAAIVDGGIVNMGEVGTSRAPSADLAFDTSTSEGIYNLRQLFAEKVDEILVEARNNDQNMSYGDAIGKAAQKYPDLFQAYKSVVPGK